jgi:hypothetical protein
VEDIRLIHWSDQPFASLTIPIKKKEVITGLTQSRFNQSKSDGRSGATTKAFSDVFEGRDAESIYSYCEIS